MGFMGLGHWVESDCAADFRHAIINETRNISIKHIDEELQNTEWGYNTPGYVNITLLIESGDITEKMITLKQVDKVLDLLLQTQKLLSKDDHDFKPDFKRMIKSMQKFRPKVEKFEVENE